MTSSKVSLIAFLAVILIAPIAAAEPTLQRILDETYLDCCWKPPAAKQIHAEESLFSAQLIGRAGADPSAIWRRTEISSNLSVLHEAPDMLGGRGVYVIGALPVDDLLLQAPHRFNDLHTGTILTSLIAESPPSAAAFNSTPRRFETDEGIISADMAHQEASTMIAFTRAFLRANPHGRVVQLHGFESDKRKSTVGRSADFIVSNGTQQASPYVQAVAACLMRTIPDRRTLLFPRDVSELGATTNTIGAAVRTLIGKDHFLHIEANLPTRIALKDDSGMRNRLMTCLRESR